MDLPSRLQFGHGGDAVETRNSARPLTTPSRLQFGHGGDAVETEELMSYPIKQSCFNSATAVMPWRPRIHGDHLRRSSMLQFGHGGDAVETGSSIPPSFVRLWLQFGHGGDAVETSFRSGRGPLAGSRFNSATAVMPWRPAEPASAVELDEKLQFGHGGDAVETGVEGRPILYLHTASIRPRR